MNRRWAWGWLGAALMLGGGVVMAQDPPPPTARQLRIVPELARMPSPASPPEKARTAYLLSYFKEHVHSLHFAVSRDGYRFTDVNDGQPVLSGEAVAGQKGIRDPYLMRGEDGAF